MSTTKSLTSDLTAKLANDIPLSVHMGIRVDSVAGDHVSLSAPLAPNINYNSTAFGGSVYSLAVLSCWALVTRTVNDLGLAVGYVVIQDGQMEYFTPIDGEMSARSGWAVETEPDRFVQILNRKGLARVELVSNVVASDTPEKVCATLRARFVAEVKSYGDLVEQVLKPSKV